MVVLEVLGKNDVIYNCARLVKLGGVTLKTHSVFKHFLGL
jgi:hypothetical protein